MPVSFQKLVFCYYLSLTWNELDLVFILTPSNVYLTLPNHLGSLNSWLIKMNVRELLRNITYTQTLKDAMMINIISEYFML